MPVTFATELEEIKEYTLRNSEKNDKKRALKLLKRNRTQEVYVIRNILYRAIPKKESYVEKKMDGHRHGGIYWVDGCSHDESLDVATLYKDSDGIIEYEIYINKFNKMVVTVSTAGFGPQNHFKNFYTIGDSLEQLYKSEYLSKLYVLNIARDIFAKYNIM